MTSHSLARPRANAWLAGALVIGLVELVALGSTLPGLMATVLVLHALLGLACGAVIAGHARLVRALPVGAGAGALLLAVPAAAPLLFAAHHLFDGGLAATLPGASWGGVWVPAAGVALTAVALWFGQWLWRRASLRPVVIGIVVAATVLVEYGNRRFWPSEYPDVHAFLVVVSVVMAGLAVHLAMAGRAPAALSRLRAPALAAALAVVLVPVAVVLLFYGLEHPRARWTVATRGMHTRQMTRLARAFADRDGDGFARILGGGDCDDGDAGKNPGMRDVPGNGRDEDCDGKDAAAVSAPVAAPGQRMLAEWRDSDAARAALQATREYHVVWILVDALRADVMAPSEVNRADFPRLHELAAGSRQFTRVFSPAAGTDMVLASLLTGRVNPNVAIEHTIIEAMADTGRMTHGVIPREVLRWAGQTLVTRGFAGVDRVINDRVQKDVGSSSTGGETTDRGLAFVDGAAGAPWFLWLHYFDVHEHHQIELSDARLREALGGADSADPMQRYRATVKLVDGDVGRLMDELKHRGIWDKTIVILLSDHGEGLGEDPRLPDAHGRFVYNQLTHVPLLIRVPGVAPAVIDRPVSLLDVPPTLLALTGAKGVAGMDGRDLLADVFGGTEWGPDAASSEARPIVLNESEQYGVIEWPYKLMVRPQENLTELYDLSSDFAEKKNVAHVRVDLVARLKNVYYQFPAVTIDRTRAGRQKREALARPPLRKP